MQQSNLGIEENQNVPNPLWTLHNIDLIILNTCDFASPKTELKLESYDQYKKAKNKCLKKGLTVRFITKLTSKYAHLTTKKYFIVKPQKIQSSRTLNHQMRLIDEGVKRFYRFSKICIYFSAIYSWFSAIFPENLKTSRGALNSFRTLCMQMTYATILNLIFQT